LVGEIDSVADYLSRHGKDDKTYSTRVEEEERATTGLETEDLARGQGQLALIK
jgi:hypothetical protein